MQESSNRILANRNCLRTGCLQCPPSHRIQVPVPSEKSKDQGEEKELSKPERISLRMEVAAGLLELLQTAMRSRLPYPLMGTGPIELKKDRFLNAQFGGLESHDLVLELLAKVRRPAGGHCLDLCPRTPRLPLPRWRRESSI